MNKDLADFETNDNDLRKVVGGSSSSSSAYKKGEKVKIDGKSGYVIVGKVNPGKGFNKNYDWYRATGPDGVSLTYPDYRIEPDT